MTYNTLQKKKKKKKKNQIRKIKKDVDLIQ